MSEDAYTRLREFFDAMPGGFPATDSGVEIKILKKLYTPEAISLVEKPGMEAPPIDFQDTFRRIKAERGLAINYLATTKFKSSHLRSKAMLSIKRRSNSYSVVNS